MTKTVVVGVMGALLLAAMPVQAQPIEAQAIAAARAITLRQAGNTTYQRSRLRTWIGIGLMTAGFNLAFFGKECGTTGSLGPGYMQTGAFGSVSISAAGLRPVSGAECAIGFTLTSRVNLDGQEDSLSRPVQLARRSQLDLTFLSGPAVPEELGSAIADSVLGSAVVSESWPRGRMVAGLGMAGVGLLLTTVFANVPVEVTRLDRSGVAIGSRFSW
jgi:hypothetical protein